MFSAILLSGGRGKRMKKDMPKQYLLLAGKPIIMHSLERLDKLSEINEIIVVCEEEFKSSIQLMLKQYNIETNVIFAHAGTTRQESVYNGLKYVNNDKVIIHEAARPFATLNDFKRLIESESPNATLGYSIPYTVVKGSNIITDLLDRDELINVQLPQKFDTNVIRKVHENARVEKKLFTEDAGMVFHYTGLQVQVVNGSSFNIKITEAVDLLIGEIIYNEYIACRK